MISPIGPVKLLEQFLKEVEIQLQAAELNLDTCKRRIEDLLYEVDILKSLKKRYTIAINSLSDTSEGDFSEPAE